MSILHRGDLVRSSHLPDWTDDGVHGDRACRRPHVEVGVASAARGPSGGIISCGQAPAFARALVLVGGPAFSVPMEALEDAKRRSRFIEHLFCRFSDYLLAQVMQSVACNAFHTDHRTRRALAAPRPGPHRRPDRADAAGAGGFAWACSARRSTRRFRRWTSDKPRFDRPRRGSGDRSRRAHAPGMRMLSRA